MGGAGFYSMYLCSLSTLVVYDPHSSLSSIIALCTKLCLDCLLSHRYGTCFNKVIMQFSIDLKGAYLHILVVKHHHHFYSLFGNLHLFSGSFCHRACYSPYDFTSLAKPIQFLCRCRGFHVHLYFDGILVLILKACW